MRVWDYLPQRLVDGPRRWLASLGVYQTVSQYSNERMFAALFCTLSLDPRSSRPDRVEAMSIPGLVF